MYNFKAIVVKPIVIKKKVWCQVGDEVNVQSETQGAEVVDIILSQYAKINTAASDVQEIEGTSFVTKEK